MDKNNFCIDSDSRFQKKLQTGNKFKDDHIYNIKYIKVTAETA